jgi:hypothetical protein
MKRGTNHPWVKGILNWSDKAPGPLQRGNNNKNAKKLARSLIFVLLEND